MEGGTLRCRRFGSAIGADSIVDIQAGVVAIGNPCRVLRPVDKKRGRRTMEAFLEKLVSGATSVAGKLLFSVLLLVIGRLVVKYALRLLEKSKLIGRMEGTARTFFLSFAKVTLYTILIITVIGTLGVPLASIVAILASIGAAIGLAMQGALSNLTGGVMLMLFKPFRVGDYIEAAGASGTVREVTLFYTSLTTADNRRVTIPNGSLMNANIVDCTAEPTRRVDLTVQCARTENVARIRALLLDAMAQCEGVLQEPDPPFARVSAIKDTSMEFAARVWCKNSDYWNVYHALSEAIMNTLRENAVQLPAVRVLAEKE